MLVTGGRDHEDKDMVRAALEPYRSVKNILISGGADGWDYLTEQVWGMEFQLPYVVKPAPWDRAGKAAGMMRNMTMLDGNAIAPYGQLIPDVVVAGPGGKGTHGCIREAEKRGIEVVRCGS